MSRATAGFVEVNWLHRYMREPLLPTYRCREVGKSGKLRRHIARRKKNDQVQMEEKAKRDSLKIEQVKRNTGFLAKVTEAARSVKSVLGRMFNRRAA
jgi:hypothetical protein